jgi:hypothetical protein
MIKEIKFVGQIVVASVILFISTFVYLHALEAVGI